MVYILEVKNEFDYESFYAEHMCRICGKQCRGRRSLGNHLSRAHKRKIYDYLLEFIFDNEHPVCACGCGTSVNWHKTQYRFNQFVNGHNAQRDGFSSENQPTFTDEQVKARSKAIRRAYKQRKKQIAQKISDSLRETWSNEERRKALREAQRRGWQKPDVKKRQSVAQRRAWSGDAGEERRKKVFTPEFRRKIAEANMRRDVKHSSKKEAQFIQHLRTFAGDDIVPSWWYNGDEIKCYDAYIPSQNMLIEFDGVYWHGLDRESEWTMAQLKSISNDITKNRLAAESGLELIRIASDVNYSHVKDFEGLRELAYHHQLSDGTVIKQGTFHFRDEKHPIITREQLIRINEPQFEGPGRAYTEEHVLPFLLKFFREHARAYGWFYPQPQPLHVALDKVRKSITKLDVHTAEEFSSTNGAGTKYLKALFKSYWHVDRGPVHAFWDDKKFEKVLRYRLGLNNSKMYNYTLEDGTAVECRETFDINIKNVRFGLIVQRNSVSFFKPHAAACIYTRYLKGVDKPVVWDPSCGFGARLLGFAATCPGGTYIGTEPADMTYRDLCCMRDDLDDVCSVQLHNMGSEVVELEHASVDLVFTSPPYFDKEKYFDEPGQCWRDYDTVEAWIDGYLRPTFRRAWDCLRPDGRMVINIDSERRDIMVDVAEDVGFRLEEELRLRTGRDHFNRKHGHVISRTEPILAFRRT